VNDEQAKRFASLLRFMILLHWKTGLLTNAQVLGQLSLQ
jgi:hypothetical protein